MSPRVKPTKRRTKGRKEQPAPEQPKHPGGRPTKLTPELQEKVVVALRAGGYIETAAAYAGISKNTFYDWLKQGARDRENEQDESQWTSPFAQFSDAVEKAMADAELQDVTLIGRHGKDSWQALAWRLERKHPERWGRKVVAQPEDPDSEGKKGKTRAPQYFRIGGQLLEI